MILAAMAVAHLHHAQTKLNKSIPYQKGKVVSMHFDYPEMIRVSSHDGNEVLIQGTVSINGGENDDAFELDIDDSGNSIAIKGYIKDLNDLPQRITIIHDGQKIMFRDKAELKKYQAEHGKGYSQMNFGPELDIILEIKVPRNAETRVESVYGFVEIKNYSGPLTALSTYGGVDVAVNEKSIGEINAETNYGEIFTNLDTKFGGDKLSNRDFHTYVTAKPGSGPRYNLESKYGNVYIRKATN